MMVPTHSTSSPAAYGAVQPEASTANPNLLLTTPTMRMWASELNLGVMEEVCLVLWIMFFITSCGRLGWASVKGARPRTLILSNQGYKYASWWITHQYIPPPCLTPFQWDSTVFFSHGEGHNAVAHHCSFWGICRYCTQYRAKVLGGHINDA